MAEVCNDAFIDAMLDAPEYLTTPPPRCADCGSAAKLTCGAEVYPHRADLADKPVWVCACGARCGCHPGTIKPLGTPAGPETRAARQRAHRAFDQLWKSGRMSRKAAYRWLAEQLDLHPDDCHIGMMQVEMADRVCAVADALLFNELFDLAEEADG